MNRQRNFILLIIGIFLLTACAYNAGLVKTTYNLLAASQASYDTAMKVAVDLYAQKRIGNAEKQSIIAVGTTYATAHNAAVNALASYEETKNADEQKKMEIQITIATTALTDLLQMIRPYLEVN